MSSYAHGRPAQPALYNLRAMLNKVEAELANGYVEIEVEGLSARRLFCIYAVAVRQRYQRTIGGMRSLFRLHPAH